MQPAICDSCCQQVVEFEDIAAKFCAQREFLHAASLSLVRLINYTPSNYTVSKLTDEIIRKKLKRNKNDTKKSCLSDLAGLKLQPICLGYKDLFIAFQKCMQNVWKA